MTTINQIINYWMLMSQSGKSMNTEVLDCTSDELKEASQILELFDEDYTLFKEIERGEAKWFHFTRNNSTISFYNL